ncbi:MAG: Ig-like domain-containing protein [Saprospiraceae bacterium]|nr:Ig-like domain-containing protein [Saprospiraceae bacterium]
MRKALAICILYFLIGMARAQPSANVLLVTDETSPHFGSLLFQNLEAFLLETLYKQGYSSQHFFKIYSEKPNEHALPMLGKLSIDKDLLYFTPRFPFVEGKTYWVDINIKETHQVNEINIPIRTEQTPPKVTAIYPSSKQWPANQLKFYICFDRPMRFGEAYQHIQLLDENGQELQAPFLELEQELWNKDQTRLTVWFDPGRIKTMLIPNQEKGTPLDAGKKYELIIQDKWLAINGLSLQKDYHKNFEVVAADHIKPQPDTWQIVSPKSKSKTPLILRFQESMDFAMLHSGINVLDNAGNIIYGKVHISDQESVWQLMPDTPWQSGEYTIRVSADIEDLAGNNLSRAFDQAYQKHFDEDEPKDFIDLKFTIR